MKKLALTALLVLALAPFAEAAYTNGIRANIYWYTFVPAQPTQGYGVTGLDSNIDWVCFARTNLWNFSATEAAQVGGDLRAATLGLVKSLSDVRAAQPSTNRPAKQTISEGVRTSTTGADLLFTHTIETEIDLNDSNADGSVIDVDAE